MPVTEPQRLALHAAARQQLGADHGDTLMSLLPPANTDLATRQDLDALETRITARFDVEAAKVGTRFAQLDTRFAQLEATIERRLTHSLRWTIGIITAVWLAGIGWITQLIGAL
jgi:type IV secretory pathway VirD2 relaxase